MYLSGQPLKHICRNLKKHCLHFGKTKKLVSSLCNSPDIHRREFSKD